MIDSYTFIRGGGGVVICIMLSLDIYDLALSCFMRMIKTALFCLLNYRLYGCVYVSVCSNCM